MRSYLILLVLLLSSFSSTAFATGPGQGAMTATLRGMASAGAAAYAEDPSAMFFNVATLTQLERTQLTLGVAVLDLHFPITNEGFVTVPGTPVSGGKPRDKYLVAIPNGYFMWDFSPDLKLGFGLSAPYGGFGVERGDGWFGRYFLQRGSFITRSFDPSVAYQVTDQLAIGGGANLQYTKLTREAAVDFGSLGAALGVPGAVPGANDGTLHFEGTNYALGYNIGITFKPLENTTLGLAYHSQVTHHMQGDMSFALSSVGRAVSAATGAFVMTGGKVVFALPAIVDISIWQQITEKWGAGFGVNWQDWSRQSSLIFTFDNPAQATIIVPLDWRDTYRFSLGTRYQINDKWVMRAGVAHEQTPVSDVSRGPLFPQENLVTLAIGGGYQIKPNIRIDAAYQRRFATRHANFNLGPLPVVGTARGSAGNRANGFIVQATWLIG